MTEYDTQPIGDQYEQLVAEYDALRMHCNDLTTERDRSLAERDEARALVSDMFALQCARPDPIVGWLRPRYDHMASETLKGVQAKLISWGLVKREECARP